MLRGLCPGTANLQALCPQDLGISEYHPLGCFDKFGPWWAPGCTLTQLLVSNLPSGGREVTQLPKPPPSHQVLPPHRVGPHEQRKCWGAALCCCCCCRWGAHSRAGRLLALWVPQNIFPSPRSTMQLPPIPFAPPFLAEFLAEGEHCKHSADLELTARSVLAEQEAGEMQS